MFDKLAHDKIKRKNKVFALTAIGLAALFAGIRILLTYNFIDPDNHFYIPGTDGFVLSADYIIAACVIIIYILSVFLYKGRRNGVKCGEAADCFVQGSQSQVFSASLALFLFMTAAVLQGYAFINPGEALAELKGLSFIDKIAAYIKNYPFDSAIFFASVLSGVYFFKTAAMSFDMGDNLELLQTNNNIKKQKHKYSSMHIILSFMPVAWAFLNVFKAFFDMSKSVNSPVRIYELMSFLFIASYFVRESRMLLTQRCETAKFFTYAYIAVIISSASALPNLIWSSFWIMRTNSGQIIYALEISLVVYILSRIYSQIRYGSFLLCEEEDLDNPAEELKFTQTQTEEE
ncbi:MAG: hypothetical protein FWH10_01815 [Oscillospiraceae bacterium]|nr:hypothetical protein [Oscillospiraceae bacterium]